MLGGRREIVISHLQLGLDLLFGVHQFPFRRSTRTMAFKAQRSPANPIIDWRVIPAIADQD